MIDTPVFTDYITLRQAMADLKYDVASLIPREYKDVMKVFCRGGLSFNNMRT
jgi:hypothetical protein